MISKEMLKKLKVITDTANLEILKLLAKNNNMCSCKILKHLNITHGTLSHHMKILFDAKIVNIKKEENDVTIL